MKLASSNEELQTKTTGLETANAELHAKAGELETANAELRSANAESVQRVADLQTRVAEFEAEAVGLRSKLAETEAVATAPQVDEGSRNLERENETLREELDSMGMRLRRAYADAEDARAQLAASTAPAAARSARRDGWAGIRGRDRRRSNGSVWSSAAPSNGRPRRGARRTPAGRRARGRGRWSRRGPLGRGAQPQVPAGEDRRAQEGDRGPGSGSGQGGGSMWS